MRRSLALGVVLISACDVEVSLGDHDAGDHDAAQHDAMPAIDAGHDAAPIDGGIDANDLDANDLDANDHDVGSDAGDDGGVDAARTGDHDASADVGLDAPAMCAVPDAGACVQCQAMTCCAEYLACVGAATCPCIVDCVLNGHTPAECAVHCGADHGESTPLITCAQHHCTCP